MTAEAAAPRALRLAFLGIAAWGAVHPMSWFVAWSRAEGWDLRAMLDAWHANAAATGLFWDLAIAATAFAVWVASEAAARRDGLLLVAIPATVLVGLAFALPLHLFLRSRAR